MERGPLVMGWPVDSGKRQKLEKLLGSAVPRPYTNSVKMSCTFCGLPIWIGPRSQQITDLGGSASCPQCAMEISEDSPNVIDLGNPEDVAL